jgi:hypothetical protein
MWWILGIAVVALLVFLLVSVLPNAKRRSGIHDFERHETTEHLYRY